MNKNIINKSIVIYNNGNVFSNNIFLVVISLRLGWGIIKLSKNNNLTINNILYGYNKLYKFFFKLKGFGYKWKYNLNNNQKKNTIYFKLGFTHRISVVIKKNIKFKMNKKRFIIKSRSYKLIRNNLNFLFILFKRFLYNKKGIYLRGTKYKIKISKKKSKF